MYIVKIYTYPRVQPEQVLHRVANFMIWMDTWTLWMGAGISAGVGAGMHVDTHGYTRAIP